MCRGIFTFTRVQSSRRKYRKICVNNPGQNGYMFRPGDAVSNDEFLDEPPGGPALTSYDRAHLKLYLRLLDADSQGADWTDVAKTLFGLCASSDGERAKRVHSAHLARAKWLSEKGFAELLRPRLH